jgi:hypothetical protein
VRKSPRAVTAPKNHPTDLLALGWIRHSQVAVGLGQTAARFANRFWETCTSGPICPGLSQS